MKIQNAEKTPTQASSAALLQRLFAGGQESEIAWKEFLGLYSNLFLKIIWRYEKDRDAVMEKYLYACSKLASNDFSILRSFNPEHSKVPPKLSTWLTIVVKNLCLEAHRVQHGRRRFPRALLRMSDFDRKVFDLYYWRGHSPEQIDSILANEPDGRQQSVGTSLARITAQFTKAVQTRQTYVKPVFVSYSEGDPDVVSAQSRNHEEETPETVMQHL